MARIEAEVGTVRAPRAGGAWISLRGQEVYARNALNARTPPGSRVVIAQDPKRKTWAIVGRER